jgi:hypothetical protein
MTHCCSFRAWLFAVLAGALAFCSSAGPAQAAWRVWLGETEMTALAAPLDRGNMPEVNVVLLGPPLGLAPAIRGDELTLTGSGGKVWRVRNSDMWLESDSGGVPLSSPALIQGAAAYLPLAAVAEVAGLECKLDSANQRVDLSPKQSQTQEGGDSAFGLDSGLSADGWQAFTVKKTAQENAAQSAGPTDALRPPQEDLPPAHDHLQLGTGFGYAQGLDWGLELTGSGGFAGKQLDLGSLLTIGHRGLRLEEGRVSVRDDERKWNVEAGDVFSDIRGLARGLRWSRAAPDGHWRSLSLYLKSENVTRKLKRTVVAYGDRVRLAPGLYLGGEVDSSGARFVRVGLQSGGLSLMAYGRHASELDQGCQGAFFSLPVGRLLALYGGVSASGTGATGTDWRTLAVRVPLTRGVDLTLEHAGTSTLGSDQSYQSAMLTFPVGPVRMITRYQIGNSSGLMSGLAPQESGGRDLTTSLVYFTNPKINFDYQVNAHWQEGSERDQYEQLVSTYQLSERTQLQTVTAFPGLVDPERLRLRLNQKLRTNLSLLVDYGQLAPFQSDDVSNDRRGFRVMLRKEYFFATPSRGGEVSGRVVDEAGRPVTGVAVQLGPYRAVSGRDGRYRIRFIPSGSYHLALNEASIPANYRPGNGARDLIITSRSREQVDLMVIPLNAITGHIYEDRNGNGRYDPGEGIAGAVLHLDGFATATTTDGDFGFYNIEPGHYTVRLDPQRLPEGYRALGPAEIAVDLPADRPVTGVDFQVEKPAIPIILQGLP